MTRKRDCSGELPATNASSHEEDDVQTFCGKIKIEEISFETWQKNHSKLDLLYPLKISRSQLSQTSSTVIKLSRTIRAISTNGRRIEQREKFECEISLCQNMKDKKVLKYPGLGDRCDDAAGDLLIILTISD
ncbi:MAG: hypothetical protein H7318_15800 [Oligoflexus sp.]|nr:hypothetical protein [Oligoflexus sp.]